MNFFDWMPLFIVAWLLGFALFIWTLGCRWYWKTNDPDDPNVPKAS